MKGFELHGPPGEYDDNFKCLTCGYICPQSIDATDQENEFRAKHDCETGKRFMETLIFETKFDFDTRDDPSFNGVSLSFTKAHPDYEAQNTTNTGCWNCGSCTHCNNCEDCTDCHEQVGLKGHSGYGDRPTPKHSTHIEPNPFDRKGPPISVGNLPCSSIYTEDVDQPRAIPGVECDFIAQEFTYNTGTAIKHLCRSNGKHRGLIHLKQAKQFIEYEIKRLEKNK